MVEPPVATTPPKETLKLKVQVVRLLSETQFVKKKK
jgi:hypothetical protein